MPTDFDIQEFARLFDAALASENPSVKKALRNFLLVAAIAESESNPEHLRGPFARLFKQIEEMNQRIVKLELDASMKSYKHDFEKQYMTTPYTTDKYAVPPSTWSRDTQEDLKKYLLGGYTVSSKEMFKGIMGPDES